MESNQLGLMHFWTQGDEVSHFVGYLLLAMSILSWYFILLKGWQALRVKRTASQALEEFWKSSNIEDATKTLAAEDAEELFSPLAIKGLKAVQLENDGSLQSGVDRSELITRSLRQAINEVSARLESGLTFLASIGSTAPFVGLFGTVWGIYHALISIAAQGQIQIEKVAGPVGEALVMTAAGLAVAIPAVLAYNAYVRLNRLTLMELDGFAHDLHSLLTTGSRESNPSGNTGPTLFAKSAVVVTGKVGT
jgi:biopolymer transport protein ExbB